MSRWRYTAILYIMLDVSIDNKHNIGLLLSVSVPLSIGTRNTGTFEPHMLSTALQPNIEFLFRTIPSNIT